MNETARYDRRRRNEVLPRGSRISNAERENGDVQKHVPPSRMTLHGLDHVALSVRDVERSVQWYVEVLGLERQHEGQWNDVPTFVGRGAAGIALFPVRTGEHTGRSPNPTRLLHFAWRADRENFVRAQRELKERGIEFHCEDHGISNSIYFRDPDGHEIEITTYEIA